MRRLFFALMVTALSAQAQASCLVLGDSIAVGLAQQLRCSSVASVGKNTAWITRHVPKARFGTVIISAGSNDWRALRGLGKRLQVLRDRVRADRVVWVLPALRGPRILVNFVAGSNRTVGFAAGKDRIHPKSYPALARAIGNP